MENSQDYLLHGDVHNDNIILSQRGWITIDPKGIVGPKEYETAAYLRNPYYDLPHIENKKEIVTERIIDISDGLHFDKEVVKNWAFAQAILSAVWILEDIDGRPDYFENYLKSAQLFESMQL